MLCVRRIMSGHARGCIGWEEGWSQLQGARGAAVARGATPPHREKNFVRPRSDETVLVPVFLICVKRQSRSDELVLVKNFLLPPARPAFRSFSNHPLLIRVKFF